jgi:5-methylcytosine-specific restriction endonuclease McrA
VAVSRSRAARASRRRQNRLRKVVNDLREDEWDALKSAWAGCAYCGADDVPLQRDCVLPVSRGGRYTLANVVPACRSCNTSKCNAEVTTWLRHKHLDEAAFLLRLQQIQSTFATGLKPPM